MEFEVEVIYEDPQVLVVNKPSGMLIHEDGRTRSSTLVDWAIDKCPGIKNVTDGSYSENGTESISRPGIVHRLDKQTSGVVLIAKTQEAYQFIKQQFQDRTVFKEYHAFVYGQFKKSRGCIVSDIGKDAGDFKKWSAHNHRIRGPKRDAETEYVADVDRSPVSFVRFYPKTGRTHQIRVHADAIGHAVISDSTYAHKRQSFLGFNRLALHARVLSLHLNPGAAEQTFVAAYPEDFQNAVIEYEKGD